MTPIEEDIIENLRRSGPCSLDEVVTYLPLFSWGEVFCAVDRMSKDGRLIVRQSSYSAYQISLGSQVSSSNSTSSQTRQITGNVIPIPHVAA